MTKTDDERCRHGKAWPTLFGVCGIMWCPTCGAFRSIKAVPGTTNAFRFSEPYWVRPGESWLRDMEKNEKANRREADND